jgi:hypothetical protein
VSVLVGAGIAKELTPCVAFVESPPANEEDYVPTEISERAGRESSGFLPAHHDVGWPPH